MYAALLAMDNESPFLLLEDGLFCGICSQWPIKGSGYVFVHTPRRVLVMATTNNSHALLTYENTASVHNSHLVVAAVARQTTNNK